MESSTPQTAVQPQARAAQHPAPPVLSPALAAALWRESGSAAWGLTQAECTSLLEQAGARRHWGFEPGRLATPQEREEYLRGLRLSDLVLAGACARGHAGAWERLIALHRQPLERAAIAIAGNESLGSELADQLWAELYGLAGPDGQRHSPLDSYQGRGSLAGWLRTILAQRHVDHLRRTRRESPLDQMPEASEPSAPAAPESPDPARLAVLSHALERALAASSAAERFLLASYYLDGRRLRQIAQILGVHEATVSRQLARALHQVRKRVLFLLQRQGLSRHSARDALGADPRDIELNLKKILQNPGAPPFPEKGQP